MTALTTGGFGGFDVFLKDTQRGFLRIHTDLVQINVPISSIRRDELIFANGGIDRRIRIFRLPDFNNHTQVKLERNYPIIKGRDNAFYVRVTFEDGQVAWSSSTYIID